MKGETGVERAMGRAKNWRRHWCDALALALLSFLSLCSLTCSVMRRMRTPMVKVCVKRGPSSQGEADGSHEEGRMKRGLSSERTGAGSLSDRRSRPRSGRGGCGIGLRTGPGVCAGTHEKESERARVARERAERTNGDTLSTSSPLSIFFFPFAPRLRRTRPGPTLKRRPGHCFVTPPPPPSRERARSEGGRG